MTKRLFHKMLYAVPGARAVWGGLNRLTGRWPGAQFSGWGMVTDTFPPWHAGGGDPVVREFMRVHGDVTARVRAGAFLLSQFNDAPDQVEILRELMWRHYLVFWSVRFATRATAVPVKTLVECGVCDGLTAYFAMSAAGPGPFKAYLYDAWEGMKAPYLLDSEKKSAGRYAFLSLETTKENLRAFEREATFVKGFIPESFAASGVPEDVVWLHIDLNSALPTQAALDTLFDRMPPGAVILFDDYGWNGYQDTKAAVDKFVEGKPGLLMPVPTGQALFFKQRA